MLTWFEPPGSANRGRPQAFFAACPGVGHKEEEGEAPKAKAKQTPHLPAGSTPCMPGKWWDSCRWPFPGRQAHPDTATLPQNPLEEASQLVFRTLEVLGKIRPMCCPLSLALFLLVKKFSSKPFLSSHTPTLEHLWWRGTHGDCICFSFWGYICWDLLLGLAF